MGIGPFQPFKPFNRHLLPQPVQIVQNVQPLRSVQDVKDSEPFNSSRFKDSVGGRISRFGNFRRIVLTAGTRLEVPTRHLELI